MLYIHEMEGDGIYGNESTERMGRNAGLQVLPFNMTLTDDGRSYISFSAVGFKNMNTNHKFGTWKHDDAFSVIDRIDILSFRWDNGIEFSNVKKFQVDVADIDLKLGLAKSERSFLAIKAGGAFGTHKTSISLLTNDPENFHDPDQTGDIGIFQGRVRGGLEFVKQGRKGSRVQAGVGLEHGVYNGLRMSESSIEYNNLLTTNYNNQVAQSQSYYEGRGQFYANLGIPTQTSAQYFIDTGISKPKDATAPEYMNKQRIKRVYTLATPYLEFSKNVRNGKQGLPVRVGVGISANIPLSDEIFGEGLDNNRIDLKSRERNLLNGKIFINF